MVDENGGFLFISHSHKDMDQVRQLRNKLEEAGWGLEHATNEILQPETKQESNSLIDELERLGNMYEKGLLTDEEFAAMKKLMEGD